MMKKVAVVVVALVVILVFAVCWPTKHLWLTELQSRKLAEGKASFQFSVVSGSYLLRIGAEDPNQAYPGAFSVSGVIKTPTRDIPLTESYTPSGGNTHGSKPTCVSKWIEIRKLHGKASVDLDISVGSNTPPLYLLFQPVK